MNASNQLIIKRTHLLRHTVSYLFAANLIDVLKVLELSEDMEGVSLEAGLCTSRKGREETDLSLKIDKKIQVSAPTKQLFPGKFKYNSVGLFNTVIICVCMDIIMLVCVCVCVFPLDSPFPTNFSVMTTVKAVKGSQVFLLSLYDSQVCSTHTSGC